MIRGIAIMGLNVCGKSTLAHTIAKRLDFYEMDVEDYYFRNKRTLAKLFWNNNMMLNVSIKGKFRILCHAQQKKCRK